MKYSKNLIYKIILLLTFFLNSTYANNLDKITLQLHWKHQFEFAGFYMAKEKGFYKDNGLDVNFVEFNTDINIIEKVVNTPNMYGITYSNIIFEYLKGEPVVFIANFFKQSPLAIVTTKDINQPSDLKGKKVMGVGEDINSAMVLVMFKKFGITKNDFISVPPSFHIDEFVNKEVDAMVIYTTNETFLLDKLGIQYNILNPTVYGAEFYDVNLFTSKNETKLHPNRVMKFKEASIKGWKYALEHKDETIQVILDKYNTQNKSLESLQYEAKQIENIMHTHLYEIGSIDENRIKLMMDDFKDLGLVSNAVNTNLTDFIFKDNKYNIKLTKEELAYLNTNQTIKVHNEKDWEPYNFNIDGIAQGFSIDYMNLVALKIGMDIEYINGYSWYDFMGMIKNGSLDVMLNISITEDRKKFLEFTTAYSQITDSVIVKKGDTQYKSLKDFENKTLAVIKGFYEEELLKKYYPKIKLLYFDSSIDALKAVTFNKANGAVNNIGAAQYLISKYQITDLTAAFNIPDERFNLELHMATGKNNTILRDILEKGKNLITKEELVNLQNKWFAINDKESFDYTLALQILGLVLLTIILIIIWNVKLNQKVQKEILKNKEQESLIHYYSKQKSMQNMLGNISHQWRHPLSELSSTLMLLDTKLLLKQEITTNDIEEITKDSKNIINFMSKTIDTFNNFYKKTTDDENKKFFIKDAMTETLFILKGSFEINNIKVKTNIDDTLQVFGNINQLEQVILSILVNAQDIFIKKKIKEPQIIISIYKDTENTFIDIEDNAKGIKIKNIDDIFNLTISDKNSTGLGLFISKNIITTKFNGDIKVFNKDDGVLFRIKLQSITIIHMGN